MAVLFLLIVKRLLPLEGAWRHFLLLFAALFFINPVIWIGEPTNAIFVTVVLPIVVPLLCGGRLLARISISMLLLSIILSSAAVLSSIRPPLDQFTGWFALLLWIGIYLFVRFWIQPETIAAIKSTRLLLLFDALSLFPCSIVLVIVLFAQYTRTYTSQNQFTDTLTIGNEAVLQAILVISALYSIALLLSVVLLAKHERLEQSQVLWNLRQQAYQNMEQGQVQVRRLRHDMNNHLQAMAGMPEDAMRSYLHDLLQSPALTSKHQFCENEIVNAVLLGKQHVIKQQKIKTDIQVSVPKECEISDIDLCAVFANCLDNAIEACQRCELEKRHIRLQARTEKGILALRLENSMVGELQFKHGELLTSKANKKNHGYGLSEIKDIVQQYNGYLHFQQKEDQFLLHISIPLMAG